MTMEDHFFLTGDTSSNGCFFKGDERLAGGFKRFQRFL